MMHAFAFFSSRSPTKAQRYILSPLWRIVFLGGLPVLGFIFYTLIIMFYQPSPMPSPNPVPSPPTPLNVVTTHSILADMIETIGGECVDVVTLVGKHSDPHLPTLPARAPLYFSQADVILYGGYRLEGALGETLERFAQANKVPTIALYPKAFPHSMLIAAGDTATAPADPHIWMDVALWQLLITPIATILAEFQPDCAAAITTHATHYRQVLEHLDHWIDRTIATIPPHHRVLITVHQSFQYYGRAYGLETRGLQGVSTLTQAGVQEARALTDFIVARSIPSLFAETTLNPQSLQAIVDAAQAKGYTLHLADPLAVDTLGVADSPTATYVGLLHTTTKAIALGLGGTLSPLPYTLQELLEPTAFLTLPLIQLRHLTSTSPRCFT